MSKNKRGRGGMIRFAREVVYNNDLEYCDAVICQVTAPRRARRVLGKPTTEAQAVVNERHAKLKFQRYSNANFVDGRDICVHLTFDKAHKPASRTECKKLMTNFLRRVKNAWKNIERPLKWLYVIEGEDGKRIHVHMLMTGGLTAAKIKALWGMAQIVNVDTLQASNQGFAALGIYLNKQGRLENGEHRWYGSRNLVDPKREELNAKIPLDEVAELGRYIQDEMYADEGIISTAERFAPVESRYEGYYCSEATAKHLEQFNEWVITVQLYRKDTPMGKAEKRRREDEEEKIEQRKAEGRRGV